MNSIILGLAALSNLTGVRSGLQYSDGSELFKQSAITTMKKIRTKDAEIIDYADMYNLRGENVYSLLHFSNGDYAVFNKETKQIVKRLSSNPYEKVDCDFKVYFEESKTNNFAYYDLNTDTFKYSSDNYAVDSNRFASIVGETYKKDNYYTLGISSDAKKISNIWYFEKLRENFSENKYGTCTLVATGIYMGYLDTFYNDDVVHRYYDIVSEDDLFDKDFDIRSFEKSPGSDNKANCYHDYLRNVCRYELDVDPEKNNGMKAVKMKALIKKEFERNNIEYSYVCSDGNLSDVWGDRTKKIIKAAIDDDRPVLVAGQTHATVAVAYNNDLVWVHAGWYPGTNEPVLRATPWSTFKVLYGFAMDVNEISTKPSDNYYDTNTRTYMSPCGFLEQRSEFNPCHMHFPTEFNPDYIQNVVGMYNLQLNVKYANAKSYPSEVMLTLKHEKEGEKDGYVEFLAYKNFHRIEFDYEYTYMSNTIQNRHGISLQFSVLKRYPITNAYVWINSRDILDRNQFGKLHLSYECEENIMGFRLKLTKNSDGVSKDGQMSITRIMVHHDFDMYI